MTFTTLSRVAGATTLGAVVTTLVLLLMRSLIESDGEAVADPEPAPPITFARLLQDEEVRIEPPLPTPPPPPDLPPPPPKTATADPFPTGPGVEFARPRLERPAGPTGAVLAEGDALPVVKVRPVYPQGAISRGIEGHVLVQFTIDELGRVVDARVIEAQPRGVFERAALRAVERFRYKPRVVDGRPTAVSGVQHLISFALDS